MPIEHRVIEVSGSKEHASFQIFRQVDAAWDISKIRRYVQKMDLRLGYFHKLGVFCWHFVLRNFSMTNECLESIEQDIN